MKVEKEVYEVLAKQAPKGCRINELIRFSYPVRKVRISVLVNKSPDESLLKVYNVLLRCIAKGFDEKSSLFDFLGIQQNDEFIMRELFYLREQGLLDLVSEKWYVTEEGKRFVKDNTILRVEEKEEYEFLVDGVSGKIFPVLSNVVNEHRKDKYIERKFNVPIKSPELLKDKYQEICDAYKKDSKGEAYLIEYDEKDILYDNNKSWIDYWFIEYIPGGGSVEPYLEVRNVDSLEKNDFLTKKFNNEYWQYVVKFTDSERKENDIIEEIESHEEKIEHSLETEGPITDLTIWQTKQKFIESLQNVKEQILIESPWIKKATREYIPYFEKLLKQKKKLIILYGIDESAEHDYNSIKELNELRQEYGKYFTLIELSEHLKDSKFTGSHRKLLIKDNDYYISGSFNFLSFAKKEGDKVANEESQLITVDVKKKWGKVIKDYNLPIQPPTGKIPENKIVEQKKEGIDDDSEKNKIISSKYKDKSLSLNDEDVPDDMVMPSETWLTDNREDPRRAVIELSTKAVKWLVPVVSNEKIESFSFDNFKKDTSDKTETGRGMNANNIMDMDYFRKKVLPSIKKANDDIRYGGIDVVHCVATAVYRSAKNRQDILDLIKKETGLDVCLMSKEQEADCTLWGYICSSNDSSIKKVKNVLLVDQGGGSTEVSLFQEQKLTFCHSFNLGTTVIRNDFFGQENLDSVRERLANSDKKYVEKLLNEMSGLEIPVLEGDALCVCVGNAITAALGNGSWSNRQVHDKVLSLDEIKKIIDARTERLSEYKVSELHNIIDKKMGKDTQTKDKVLVSRLGLPIILEILKVFGINELRINGTGLRYGVFYKNFYGIE